MEGLRREAFNNLEQRNEIEHYVHIHQQTFKLTRKVRKRALRRMKIDLLATRYDFLRPFEPYDTQ